MSGIDLGDISRFDGEPLPEINRPVDTSGKPYPTQAFARCKDGNDIPIAIVYKGLQDPPYNHALVTRGAAQKLRVYKLVIEGGWAAVVDRVHTIAVDNFDIDIVIELADQHETAESKTAIYELLKRVHWHHLSPPTPDTQQCGVYPSFQPVPDVR